MEHCSIVVMGVSGSGKSTVAEALAKALSAKFIDGDDLHPRANIVKMAAGKPLNDDDRAPWLERINDAVFSFTSKNETGVVVCSALKKRYRDAIRKDNRQVVFVFLEGDAALIAQRMQQRQGHFMKPDMLASQFAALETPAADETDFIQVNIAQPVEQLVAQIIGQLPCGK
ncbi:gluconokinase [Salinimonas sediminis]|uniref:Gluconokinase n=1 Tax=Salinimonas sediminis TaxID=2303538 RepID=A0A346NRR0_9ALTE|nr:gluconokinase [Salinimonas sediminis]AXR08217.1 gluconokinase [Salinimonas sediminis]